MKLNRLNKNVLDIHIDYESGNWEQWFLLSSDRHWDNPKSDWDLQKKHLEMAKERNAKILDFGDLFCAMQGKYDRRASKENIRPEHNTANYLDALVDTASDFFKPYAHLFAHISEGNHETAIKRNHETDLIERFITLLNHKAGTSISKGLYTGWIRFRLKYKNGQHHQTYNLNYTHGYGGGGPVTRGVIQTNRKAVYLPDAHFCISGHVHEQWLVTIPRERISIKGNVKIDEQIHVCLPTYKEEYLMGEQYHRERGRPPKPLGAYWLRFYADKKEKINFEFIRAK